MSSGEGRESSLQEDSKSASIIIPEDFESQKEMVRVIPPNVLFLKQFGPSKIRFMLHQYQSLI